MASVCPKCSSSAVIVEEHGGQHHRVCSDCGEVIDSTTSFEQERDYWSGVTSCNQAGSLQSNNLGRCRNIRQGDPNAPSRGLKPWIDYVKEVCSMMRLNGEMERGVVDLFSQAWRGILKGKGRAKKQALCGAVVFTICRQNDWPVVLSDIAAVVQSTVKELFAVKQILESEYNMHVPNTNIEDIVKTVLKKYGFVDQSFVDKSVKVVSLAKDAWITCGRSYDAVIVAAAFLVWKASPEGRGKGKRLATFRGLLPLKLPGQTAARVREMQSTLMQLVKKLPWLKLKTITADMTTKYLDDVLHIKKYLISCAELPNEQDSRDDEESATTEKTNKDETSNQSLSSSCTSPTFSHPLLWKPGRKRKLPSDDEGNIKHHCKLFTSASSVDTLLDQETVNLDEELTEKDIPESEMHLYVRSDREVEDMLRLQTVVAQETSPLHQGVTNT
ncbi:transcription factor IIIB 50 kDa subunit-like [Patiria miniata]|uniref:BRF2-like C-terminal domain-containing protein n=1 Tax=Patiria miniata TaxID=46514 RepID=A0A914B4X4_PATMI|nr:transcription factor IIIB 50 kDa subunit-like [Patiria miniata]